MDYFLISIEKEFSRCVNYVKGYEYQFYHWMSHNHPGAQLWPVEIYSGSWQYLVCLDVVPLYLNREYYLGFIYKCLCNYGISNILQDNLFIILSSTEIIAHV